MKVVEDGYSFIFKGSCITISLGVLRCVYLKDNLTSD